MSRWPTTKHGAWYATQRNKAAGLCLKCGQCPPVVGYRHCMVCLTKQTIPATRAHMVLVRTVLAPTGQIGSLGTRPSDAPRAAAAAAAAEPNLLAHCGTWHAITAATFPGWRCPACGNGALESSKDGACAVDAERRPPAAAGAVL